MNPAVIELNSTLDKICFCIQENYVRWMPDSAKIASNQNEMECRQIEAIANAADAMSDGAMVDGMIHG